MKGIITAFITLINTIALAQQFGGNPPSVRWKQIDTDTARVIFPAGLDSQAQRVASVIHFLAANNTGIGNAVRKVDIVLQNQTTVANGYVGLGPYRSEFFLTPAPNNFDLGTISWPDALALHEYRHVQQFNNFHKGLSNVMYVLFGEEGYSLAINAAIPDWFYEGDAVYNETVHTHQGRGRIPFFTNQYRSLWSAGKNYSWMKLRNGSLKDFVPSHYHLGFLLVNYGYERYGGDFWKKVTSDAASFKGLFYPFQKAIKKHAGIDYKRFREEALSFYRTYLKDTTTTDENTLTDQTKSHVTNYFFPYQLGNDSLLYLKSSYRKIPAFYIRTNGSEKKIRVKDISLDEHYSYRNGKIIYSAFEPDARWGWRDYGVIKILDINSGQQVKLGTGTKYFTPDISEDGSRIVAVNNSSDGKSEIHVLNASDGSVLQKIRSLEINVFTDPKFINDNTIVTIVRLNDGRTALAWADINTGAIERLTPPSYNVLGFPSVYKNRVYYTASYFGNDDVFAFDLQSKKIYKITDGTSGRYYVNANHDKIVYSHFTADGYQLRGKPLSELMLSEVNPMSIQETGGMAVARETDFTQMQLNNIPPRDFPVKKYSKATGLFNFHSWRPNYEDPLFTFSVYGENVLNTFQSELYYLYNKNENTSAAGLNLNYGAWFPVISAGTEFTFDRRGIANNILRQWNQLDSRIGLNIPLDFTAGRNYRFLNFGSSYVLRNEFNRGPNKDLFEEFNFSYLSHFVSFNQQVQRARQHILPRYGYYFTAQHRHAITTLDGYQFALSGGLYLPGIVSNHNLNITGAFQQRDTLRALFSTRIANARGYADYYRTNAGSRLWRLSANYHFPLLLPDWGFGNILYIQRLRSNLFYDFQRLYSDNKLNTADLRSTGVEFYADTRWWNQYNLTFGLRVNYLLDDDPIGRRGKHSSWIEFILPVVIPK